MKIRRYVQNNLNQQRLRNFLVIFGVILSLSGAIVTPLLVDLYSFATTGFLTPFQDYDQIIEKGTNYFQLLPAGSTINTNQTEDFNNYFSKPIIPCLLVPANDELISFEIDYILGVDFTLIDDLCKSIGLQRGSWPDSSEEVIVGDAWLDYKSVSIFEKNFSIKGYLQKMFTFADRYIIIDLSNLQDILEMQNLISLYFVEHDKSEIITEDKIQQFESDFPRLDYLTYDELSELKGNINSYMENLTRVITVFTSLASIVFIFALQFVTIYHRNRDYTIFYIIGMPPKKVRMLIFMENLLLFSVGLIIGIFTSGISYAILYAYTSNKFDGEYTFIHQFISGIKRLFLKKSLTIIFQSSLLIIFSTLIISLVLSWIGSYFYKKHKIAVKG